MSGPHGPARLPGAAAMAASGRCPLGAALALILMLPAEGLPGERQTMPDKGAMRIERNAAPEPNMLHAAYAALRTGDDESAARLYAARLTEAPDDPQALLGLAIAEQRLGHIDEAGAAYRRAVAADPASGAARAGKLALLGLADPQSAESRLRHWLIAHPDPLPLHFALGNLLARQKRWPEARQAYARACAGDPANPDYCHNLAVSLDRLHRPREAEKHYRQALRAQASRPGSIDPEAVARRLGTVSSGSAEGSRR